MNYEESLAKLFSLHQFGIKLGLDNIKKLLTHIGNPELYLKSIHIAGSNGKGSTASFIASILTEAGYKVGLYTSPHFVKFNERIRINGIEIPDDYIVDFINKNCEYIENESPTFFEITTALAFNYFDTEQVDYAIIETGLGGRLDATNVLQSIASVFTSISLEHINILGTNLESIAYEKSEIIKTNQKVFLADLPSEAASVILKNARKEECDIFEIKNFAKFFDNGCILNIDNEQIKIDSLPLKGFYQFKNASLAILTVTKLFNKITKFQILSGLKNVIVNSGIQGRYEIYSKLPKVIMDSAHNLEGIDLFIKEFTKEEKSYSKRILIYGAMNDKNVSEILKRLSKHFDEFYATEINYERSFRINELQDIASENSLTIKELKNPAKYIINFMSQKRNHILVVLGSMYILGEIKKNLKDST